MWCAAEREDGAASKGRGRCKQGSRGWRGRQASTHSRLRRVRGAASGALAALSRQGYSEGTTAAAGVWQVAPLRACAHAARAGCATPAPSMPAGFYGRHWRSRPRRVRSLPVDGVHCTAKLPLPRHLQRRAKNKLVLVFSQAKEKKGSSMTKTKRYRHPPVPAPPTPETRKKNKKEEKQRRRGHAPAIRRAHYIERPRPATSEPTSACNASAHPVQPSRTTATENSLSSPPHHRPHLPTPPPNTQPVHGRSRRLSMTDCE